MTARPRQILIAAAALAGPDGRVLLVLKRATSVFMQPGGKIEPGAPPMAPHPAEAFWLNIQSTPTPQAEIEEARWIDPLDPGELELASLSRHHILPACLRSRCPRYLGIGQKARTRC